MINTKEEFLEKHCYTALVYLRINKKLGTNLTKSAIEVFIKKVIQKTEASKIEKIGKNFYLYNKEYKIKITVNSTTFRIITVDTLEK